MDKVMNVQRRSVLDLLDPAEINKRASILPPSDDEFENILLVDDHVAAGSPLLMSRHVKDMLKFKKDSWKLFDPKWRARVRIGNASF